MPAISYQNYYLAGHESHRTIWACLACACVSTICIFLLIALSSPWYYIEDKDDDLYYDFRWEGVRQVNDDDEDFFDWDDNEISDDSKDLQNIMIFTLLFILGAFFCILLLCVPIILLMIPIPVDVEIPFLKSMQLSMGGVRLCLSISAMVICGCACFCLYAGWLIFFGFNDGLDEIDFFCGIDDNDFCGGALLGEDDDVRWGPSAGWVFALFSLIYMVFLCFCLIMTFIAEAVGYQGKIHGISVSVDTN